MESGMEVMDRVAVPILAVCVTVKPGQNTGGTRSTGWSGIKSIVGTCGTAGKTVDIRSPDHGITVAA